MRATSLLPTGAAPWLIFLAVALLPLALSSSWVNGAILTMLFVYLCVSWNIVGGIAGQFSIGHSLFLAAGAYTSTLLSLHLGVTPWIGMFAGAAVAAAIGVFVAWLSFRYALPPLSFALVTIALAMLGYLAISSIDMFGASRGLTLPVRGTPAHYQFRNDVTYYVVILAHVVGALALSAWLYHAKLGLYLRALRDNERAAHAIGVPVLKYKMLAMGISAALTALGGTFYAQYLQYVEPRTFASIGIVIEIILFTVVGAAGTVWGPVVGPLVLVPAGEWLRHTLGSGLPGVHLLIYGLLLVFVIRFAPDGLLGALERGRQAWRASRAATPGTSE
jgi:branched-chain amino acid transport system permease protein